MIKMSCFHSKDRYRGGNIDTLHSLPISDSGEQGWNDSEERQVHMLHGTWLRISTTHKGDPE